MRLPVVLIALLVVGIGVLWFRGPLSDDLAERHGETGAHFADHLPDDVEPFPGEISMTFDGEGEVAYRLVGVGMRKGFLTNVYGTGLYVDPDEARRLLGSWSGRTVEELLADEAFVDDLLQPELPRALRVDLADEFSSETIREQAIGTLAMEHAREHGREAEAAAALDQFVQVFGPDLEEGCEIVVAWHPLDDDTLDGGQLLTYIDRDMVAEITQPDVVFAVFRAMLDDELGIDELRREVAHHTLELLEGGDG